MIGQLWRAHCIHLAFPRTAAVSEGSAAALPQGESASVVGVPPLKDFGRREPLRPLRPSREAHPLNPMHEWVLGSTVILASRKYSPARWKSPGELNQIDLDPL
jgi:hypothetical protein